MREISRFTIFAVFIFLSMLLFSKTTIIKNGNVYLPNHTYQAESFIIIKDAKIKQIGLMANLKEAIFDDEYDAKGAFIYPAFIDPLYKGFQGKPKAGAKTTGRQQRPAMDKTKRKPYKERNYFVAYQAVNSLTLAKTKLKKIIEQGFTCLHIISDKGIITGTTTVASAVSDIPYKAVLVPEKFMYIVLKTSTGTYPSTLASLIAELMQMREDAFYYEKMKKLQFYDEGKRIDYVPEFNLLLPYFKRQKRFVFETKNIVQQRMVEILARELQVNPVIVAHSDIWRRKVKSSQDIILPLKFKPPMASRYASQGDKLKKEVEKKLYPEKLAQFIKSHRNTSLAPPGNGDYKTLYKNIKGLIKNGLSEAVIIRTLTENPARLLGISRYLGTIRTGKLASLTITDKKIFEDKVKIKKVYVEGTGYELKAKAKGTKPPAANLTGTWSVKVESAMGNFELKMILEQDGNDLSGKMTSPMGDMEISSGSISGNEVSISITAPIMGQDTKVEIFGKAEGGKIKGTISIGSMGEGTFEAEKDESKGGVI